MFNKFYEKSACGVPEEQLHTVGTVQFTDTALHYVENTTEQDCSVENTQAKHSGQLRSETMLWLCVTCGDLEERNCVRYMRI